MLKRLMLFGLFIILFLNFFTISHAQSRVDTVRINTPSFLDSKRTIITDTNAGELELLSPWGMSDVNTVAWINNDELALLSQTGAWLYNIDEPTKPSAVLEWLNPTHNRLPLFFSPDRAWVSIYPSSQRRQGNRFGWEIWHIPTGSHYILENMLPTLFDDPSEDDGDPFVGWLPDNRFVSKHDNRLLLWDVTPEQVSISQELVHERSPRTPYFVEHVAISSDGQWIATATRARISEKMIFQIWDIATGERHVLYEEDILPEQPLFIDSIQFNMNSSEVAFLVRVNKTRNTFENTIEVRRWSVESKRELQTFYPECLGTMLYAFDTYLCPERTNNSNINYVSFKQLSNNAILSQIAPLYDYDTTVVHHLSISSNITGNYLPFVEYDRLSIENELPLSRVSLWDVKGREQLKFSVNEHPILDLAISPDNTKIALLQRNQTLIVDIISSKIIETIEHYHPIYLNSWTLSPDKRDLLTIGQYNDNDLTSSIFLSTRVGRLDLTTGEFTLLTHLQDMQSVSYNTDGTQIAFGSINGEIHLYDSETMSQQHILNGQGSIQQLTYSHDGQLLVALSSFGMDVWDLETLSIINRITNVSVSNQPQFTPDNQWLIIGGTIYEIESQGQLIARWQSDDTVKRDEIRALLPQTPEQIAFDHLASIGIYRDESNTRHALYADDVIVVIRDYGLISLYGITKEK